MNFFSRCVGLGAALSGVCGLAHAQTLVPIAPAVPDTRLAGDFNADDGDLAPLGTNLPPLPRTDVSHTALDAATQSALDRASALLDARDPAALPLARSTAQSTLKNLNAAVGADAFSLATLPDDALSLRLAMGAIQAHALWGRVADSLGQRDESIAALVRAKTLLAALPVTPDSTLGRDVNLELNALLRAGLPLVAPDDVLTGIAARSHENLWQPRSFEFAPAPASGLDASPKTALLVTEGQLFPPAQRLQSLVQVPPLYRSIAFDRLPSSLQLNRMVAGYTRVPNGPNAGQWRQTVRVFYASPILTRNKRDDAARAQLLAAGFLRVHALFESQLGATNLYTRGPLDEGVTTLYLLEVSALWPQDDDDPAVLFAMGPKMPPVNTGQRPGDNQVQMSPLARPWMPIAGQNEAAPGEIMFWKAGFPRSEGEWTRELCHEYGHVALPPIAGFRPPLEPYGNGLLGETLGMMWAAQNPDAVSPGGSRADFLLYLEKQVLPSRLSFALNGPYVAGNSGTASDLAFLQGLSVVIERVYGAPVLGRAFTPLSLRGVQTQNVAARRTLLNTQSLLNVLAPAMSASFAAKKSLPVYLPAALDAPLSASDLANRAPLKMKAGSRTQGWIFIPEGAASLRIESPNLVAIGLPWKREAGATRLYFAGKSGWQKIGLVAQSDVTIGAARFE